MALVLHDNWAAVLGHAPSGHPAGALYHPHLPQLLRYVEGAGFRVLTWRDTTDTVLAYMQGRREQLLPGVERGTRVARPLRQRRLAMSPPTLRPWASRGASPPRSTPKWMRRLPAGGRQGAARAGHRARLAPEVSVTGSLVCAGGLNQPRLMGRATSVSRALLHGTG